MAVKKKHLNECSIYRAALLLDGKWSILIFRELLLGKKRFNELRSGIGTISPKTLSDRLRFLEEEGLVQRQAFAEIPPRVEYELTKKGHGLRAVFDALDSYGKKWL